MSASSNQFAFLEQAELLKENWEKLGLNEAGSGASGDRAQADNRWSSVCTNLKLPLPAWDITAQASHVLADWAHFSIKLFTTLRSAGETSSTEPDTSGPSARQAPEDNEPKGRKHQDGAARPTEEEGKYKLKNPIVWMDLEMTGAPQRTHLQCCQTARAAHRFGLQCIQTV